jgi:DNA repair protein RadC
MKPTARVKAQIGDETIQLAFYTPGERAPVLRIREMPVYERPVERLIHYGPCALSMGELLTIVCGFTEIDQGQLLLQQYGSLGDLIRAPLSELAQIRGIGERKAAHLKAIFELGRRATVAPPTEKTIIRSPADAANLLMGEMSILEQEELRIIILNTRGGVLKIHTAYKGNLGSAIVRIAELFREAIRLNAAAILVAHNHPSNDPTPSAEDISITRQIVEAGKLLNIDVLDHIVFGENRWLSLKERGLGF